MYAGGSFPSFFFGDILEGDFGGFTKVELGGSLLFLEIGIGLCIIEVGKDAGVF